MADDSVLPDQGPSIGPDYISRLFHIESGGKPYAVTGSNRGYGQFGPEEERKYGITNANRADRNAQAAAVQREAAEHIPLLTKALGRTPSPGELYLAHQQGPAGGPALLSADPNTPAWQVIRPYYRSDAIAKQAITGNIPSNNPLYGMPAERIAAGAFTGMWKDKFETGLGNNVGTLAVADGRPTGSPAGMPVDAGDLPEASSGSAQVASAAPAASGAPAGNNLGMLDPGALAKSYAQFGPGLGILNAGQQAPQPQPMFPMPPMPTANGTPAAQMLKAQILARAINPQQG